MKPRFAFAIARSKWMMKLNNMYNGLNEIREGEVYVPVGLVKRGGNLNAEN
jgi:hypothetical protein